MRIVPTKGSGKDRILWGLEPPTSSPALLKPPTLLASSLKAKRDSQDPEAVPQVKRSFSKAAASALCSMLAPLSGNLPCGVRELLHRGAYLTGALCAMLISLCSMPALLRGKAYLTGALCSILFSFCLLVSPSWSATYYVDATNGNNNNDGLSTSTAWNTIAKVNSSKFQPGDFILFKRGEVWREQLTVPSSGSSGIPITFMAYGSGDKPVIRGADLMTGWNAYSSSVWQKIGVTTEPKIVFFGGTLGNKQASLGAIDSENDWYWNSNVLYVYAPQDPDVEFTTMEAGQRAYGIVSLGSTDYITIDGLSISGVNQAGIKSQENDSWVIQNCTIENTYHSGIYLTGNPAGAGSATGLIIQDNTIGKITRTEALNVAYSGIVVGGATTPIIRRNTISTVNTWGIVVVMGSSWNAGAVSSDAQIYNNELTNCQANILLAWTEDSEVYNNHIHDSKGIGISPAFLSHNTSIYYNLIYNLAKSDDGTLFNGIDVNNGSDDGFIYNNTIYGVHHSCVTLEYGVDSSDASDGWNVQNNILDASANTEDVEQPASCVFIYLAGQDESSMTFSNNVYNSGAYAVGAYCANGGAHDEFTLAQWITHVGSDNNSQDADPLFTDADAKDFTLQKASPAIDAGTDVGLTLDYLGNTVPFGSGVDIGANEFHKLLPPQNLAISGFPN